MPRAPRSRFYDGRLYARVVDPFVSGLHRMDTDLVEPGSDCYPDKGTFDISEITSKFP